MIQTQLASENPSMPHPNPLSLRLVLKSAGSGFCKLGGRQIFWAPPSLLFPLSSRLFTTDWSPGYRRGTQASGLSVLVTASRKPPPPARALGE